MFKPMKGYLWLPEKAKKYRGILIAFSVLWMIVCTLLVIPKIRMGIIFLVEQVLLNRSLGNQLRWQQTLLLYGLSGIIIPLLLFIGIIVFVYNKNILQKVNIIGYSCIMLVIIYIIWIIMYHAAWILGDDFIFLSTTAINKYLPLDSFSGGRFFPLGHFHYNILLPISRLMRWEGIPANAHLALNVVLYTISILFLCFLFRDIEPSKSKKYSYIHVIFLCVFPFFSAAYIMIFMQCIFPETIITLLLAAFMFCYFRAIKTNKTVYYIIALIIALYTTYCKEPIFGVFVIIALTNIVFGYKQRQKKSYVFYIALLVNGVVFIVLYYLLSYSQAAGLYNEGRVEQNIIKSFLIIFIQNKMFLLISILFIIRLFFVVIRKDRDHLCYDAFLFASVGYIFAYIILHLNASYYFFPAVVLALPAFVYWSKYLMLKKNKFYIVMFLLPILIICSLNFGEEMLMAKDIISQRENTMPFINDLVTDYENGKRLVWYEQDSQNAENTFYITTRNWQKHVINAFMGYIKKMDQEYLSVSGDIEYLEKNDILLYPKANNHYQTIPEDVLMIIRDNDFELDTDIFSIYIYKNRK